MDVSGIGVQPISPTTGTPAQRQNPPSPQATEKRSGTERAAPPPGSGQVVDKVA